MIKRRFPSSSRSLTTKVNGGGSSLENPSPNQIGGVIRRSAYECFISRSCFVMDAENDASTIGISETNGGVSKHCQSVLWALGWLLELKLWTLEVAQKSG
jgi:hypothetical protein